MKSRNLKAFSVKSVLADGINLKSLRDEILLMQGGEDEFDFILGAAKDFI